MAIRYVINAVCYHELVWKWAGISIEARWSYWACNDLITAHEKWRPFTDAQNVSQISRPQNVYYHLSLSCIRHQNSSFLVTRYGSRSTSRSRSAAPPQEVYFSDNFGWCSMYAVTLHSLIVICSQYSLFSQYNIICFDHDKAYNIPN